MSTGRSIRGATAIAGLALVASCADPHREALTGPVALADVLPSNMPVMADWSPSGTYDYGAVGAFQTPSQTFTLTNTKGGPTGVLAISLSGSPELSITADACSGSSLAKGKSCAVTVQYAPTTVGQTATATLTASGKKPAASASVTLTGIGALLVAPFTSLAFSTQIAAGAFATVSQDRTAPIAIVYSSPTSLDLACNPITADLTGKIAVIARGTCTFSTKIRNVQNAGAVAVIVVNDVNGLTAMGQDGTPNQPTIPAYIAALADRSAIVARDGQSGTIGATLTTLVP